MRKLITLLLACTALVATARHIAPDEAASVAESFLNRSVAGASQKTPRRALAVGDAQKPFYAFNAEDGQGFVLVSADDHAPRILGYADSGSFDINNLPPQLAAMLDNYADNIGQMPDVAHASWKAPARSEGESKVLPTANWGQGYPYNMYAPEIDGQKAPAGCVATAMAIVMKYNQWPQTARGGEQKWHSHGTEMIYDFDRVSFDFSKMPDSFAEGEFTDTQAAEVGKLMQAAGASVKMEYSAASSGAMGWAISHGMFENFSFSPKSQYIQRHLFPNEDWLGIIQDQIDGNHPIILQGINVNNREDRHVFVCDGYDSEGLLHINWGWDGFLNGFFEPFIVEQYDNVAMVSNLFPDSDAELSAYSHHWIDDGGFIYKSVKEIKKNEPFDLNYSIHISGHKILGRFSVALTDAIGNFIEVWDNPNEWTGDRFVDGNWILEESELHDVVFNCDIKPDYRLQFVELLEDNSCRIVLGTEDSPSSIPAVGHNLDMCTVVYHFDDPDNVVETIENYKEITIPKGRDITINVQSLGGVLALYFDDEFVVAGSDFSWAFCGEVVKSNRHDIFVRARAYKDLLTIKYDVMNPGALSELIPVDERLKIYDLTLSGEINAADLKFIVTQLHMLRHLNLHDATIVEGDNNRRNYFPYVNMYRPGYDTEPTFAWNLETLIFPKNLEGFEDLPPRFYTAMPILGIPAGVKDFGQLNFASIYDSYEYVKIDNPVPAESIFMPNEDQRSQVVLYVPVGSKKAYENSPSWQGFQEIRETDCPYKGGYVQDEHFRYSAFTDFAIISGKRFRSQEEEFLIVPQDVEINGEKYPVVRTAVNTGYRTYLTENDGFTIEWPFISDIISNKLMKNYSTPDKLDDTGAEIWVLGATEAYHQCSGFHTNPMWEFKIDKENKLLLIKSFNWTLGGGMFVVIDSVKINGAEVHAGFNCIYSLDTIEDLEIEIFYTIQGVRDDIYKTECVTSTLYTKDFIENLPSTPIQITANSVTIEAEGSTTIWEGKQLQLRATVLPENTFDKTLKWWANDLFLQVDQTGLVTVPPFFEGFGEITVSARCGDAVGSIIVNVVPSAGVENIDNDVNKPYDIYTISGLKIKTDCDLSELQKLSAGIYIIRQGSLVMKLLLSGKTFMSNQNLG